MTRSSIRMVKTSAPASAEDAIPHGIEAFLSQQIRHYYAAHGDALPAPGVYDRLLTCLEKPLIIHTLRATGGNQIRAAQVLGINRNTLRTKIRALDINVRQAIRELPR